MRNDACVAYVQTGCEAQEQLMRDEASELRLKWLEAIEQKLLDLGSAPRAVRADKTIVLRAVQLDGDALEHALLDVAELRPLWIEKLKMCGLSLKAAPKFLQADRELVSMAVLAHPQALEHASEALRGDRSFVLSLVRATKAAFLTYWASDELRKSKAFGEECRREAGRGLIFTWYGHPSVFSAMRERFPATGASVPGGQAYLPVLEQLQHEPHGSASA